MLRDSVRPRLSYRFLLVEANDKGFDNTDRVLSIRLVQDLYRCHLIGGDVDQNHQNIYLFLLSQEVGFDGGRLRYLGVGASAISTAILKEEREENI